MIVKDRTKTILIAAPSSGIGKEIIPLLLEDKYSIIALGRESSVNFVQELKQRDLPIDLILCDYTSEESVKKAFQEVRNLTTKLDGVVHFVGGSLYSKKIEDITLREFNEVLSVNLGSAFLIGKEAYSWMKTTGGGNMVFFSSTTAFKPSEKKMPYGVAKTGLNALIWSFALEGSKYKIRTNGIAPGYVMTERHIDEISKKAEKAGKTIQDVTNAIYAKNPLNQPLLPSDIFELLILLLTTTTIQGQIVRIDSGQIIG